MTEQPTRAVQDYLKAIHGLGGAEAPVSPGDLTARLQVSSASVSGMLRRMAEHGWVEYEPGRGARLTPQGTTEARRVIRRHRLMELFLTRVLGLDWSEVDAEAEALEHAVSPRLEQAIVDHLGEPLEDPHGHPIPTREGKLARRDLRPLHTFPTGEPVVIREVQDERPERLRRWSDLGLVPGATVILVRHQPLDDTFEVRVGVRLLTLATPGLAGLLAEAAGPGGRPPAASRKPSRQE